MTGQMINQMLKNQQLIMQQNELIMQQNSQALSHSCSVLRVKSMDMVLSKLCKVREVMDLDSTKLCTEYDKS